MNIRVLWGGLLASILLAAGNNLLNENRVSWWGSPTVLVKPEGVAEAPGFFEGLGQGIIIGVKTLGEQWQLVLVFGVLIALSFWYWVGKKSGSWRFPLSFWTRLGMVAMFLMAGWPKFSDPEAFSFLVAQYRFLPEGLVNPFSLWLSSFEIVVALGLLLTPWNREFAFYLNVMMVMFIVALTQALARELGIVCGCFDVEGAQGAGEAFYSLVRDVVLLPLTIWLWLDGPQGFLWRWTSLEGRPRGA